MDDVSFMCHKQQAYHAATVIRQMQRMALSSNASAAAAARLSQAQLATGDSANETNASGEQPQSPGRSTEEK